MFIQTKALWRLCEPEGGPFDAPPVLLATGFASTAIGAARASPGAGCHPRDFWRMSARLSCLERRGHARSWPVVYWLGLGLGFGFGFGFGFGLGLGLGLGLTLILTCLCSIESTNSSRVTLPSRSASSCRHTCSKSSSGTSKGHASRNETRSSSCVRLPG